MDISVIVLTYNQEKTIGRTLESILSQQTDAEFEIVIGDDASTDGTENVCREYARRYPEKIVYLRREKNLGLVNNYYDCLDHCRGNYIADCAGDDFWVDSTKLQSQWEMMRDDSSVSLVATDWLCCDENGENPSRYPGMTPIKDIEIYQPGELTVDLFTHKKMIHLCSALYRKKILTDYLKRSREIFINKDYRAEDIQIVLAMANSGKIVFLPKVTLYYTIGHESISHNVDYGKSFDYNLGSLKQLRILQRYFEIPEKEITEYCRSRSAHLCAMAFRSGDTERREKLKGYLSDYGEDLPLKSRVYVEIMKLPFLWKMARNLLNQNS